MMSAAQPASAVTAETETPVLVMDHITKDFPGVRALDGVTLEVRRGEVHALVGENGAGKSTLVKVLSGAVLRDSGEVRIEGRAVEITSPHAAQQLGVSMIYQEFNLVPHLTVAENIFLGREPQLFAGVIDWGRMYREAAAVLQRLGVSIDVRAPVSRLSMAQQQMVEIAKAISAQAKLIVMDEPSATLTEHELARLFDIIRQLRADRVAIIYISHRLEEIFEIADRVTVLRDGQLIGTHLVGDVTKDDIIRMMVGRQLTAQIPKREVAIGQEALRVEGLSGGMVRDVSFVVRAGEIVCLTGLVGAGRTEVARLIFGAEPKSAGRVWVRGRQVRIRNPRHAIRHGIGFVTEDRKEQGLVLGLTVRENVTLAHLDLLSYYGFIRRQQERAAAGRFIQSLRIRTPSLEQLTRNLSGGNQQKVVLAKWLLTESGVLLFDEPTRGIDVGAKAEIYHLMGELAASGVAMLMITSELPEAIGMADRILVMHEGRIAAEIPRAEATQEKIMFYATGGK
jgi:ribose transport system ATP-binding protein